MANRARRHRRVTRDERHGCVLDALLTAAAPSWIRHARVVLGATNPGAVAAPGTVTFAEHSTYVATASWCPAQTLRDSFNGDSTIGPEWDAHGRSNSGCAEYETTSAARVDQYGGSACDAFCTGVTRTCVSYMSNQDLWRIREDSDSLHFEVVASGTSTWRTVHMLATPFDLGALRLRFGTRTDRAINTTINLSVDRFNGCPRGVMPDRRGSARVRSRAADPGTLCSFAAFACVRWSAAV